MLAFSVALISVITLVATIAHLNSAARISPISVEQLREVMAYQDIDNAKA